MTPTEYFNKVFDILVKEVGAHESMRDEFVRFELTNPEGLMDEFRFQGNLGFGGKFHRERNNGPYVSCYNEDASKSRKAAIEKANKELSRLAKELA